MTTIVWDGKILAADKRLTVTSHQSETDEKHTWRDDAEKLKLHDGKPTFKGESVLATAIYGDAHVGHAVVKAIEGGGDIQEKLNWAYRLMFKPSSRCEVLVFTDKRYYSIRIDLTKVTIEPIELKHKLVLGVGTPAASLLLKLGIPAHQAVAAVSLLSDKTSPTVDYALFNRKRKTFGPKRKMDIGNGNVLLENIRNLITEAKPRGK